MKWTSWHLLILFLISSCGQKSLETTRAPRSQEQAGIISACTTEAEAKSLAQAHQIKFRILSKKGKLVEFIGIEEVELKKLITKPLLKNIVYSELIESQGGDSLEAQAVTNSAYFGPAPASYRSPNVHSHFSHLAQIDGLEIHPQVQGHGIVIAVIDTGVDYNHPHLSSNIWTNNLDGHSTLANNKDSDGNGFIDDYVGWDFYNSDPYPNDDNGHGTHVAGLAAGTLSGVATKAKIMPIKVLSSSGQGDIGTVAAGVLYAIENGADIINLSLGGSGGSKISEAIKKLISYVELARKKDIMLVSAAGNGGFDGVGDCNDASPTYPASIPSDAMISVAAVDADSKLTSYSNYGRKSVHIAAPGGDDYSGGLLSTAISYCSSQCGVQNANYTTMSGTSMATPLVSGTLALIKSATNKKLSVKNLRSILFNSGVEASSLPLFIQSGKVINVANAIDMAIHW